MASTTVTDDHELELLPLLGSKISVWHYFGFPAKEGQFLEEDKKRQHVYCKVCKKQFGLTTSI